MKDKLVFYKSKYNSEDRCSSCNLKKTCGSLIFSCDCSDDEVYKLAEEEPVKIQTEYEWRKERKELVGRQVATAVFQDEYEKLKRWLEDNKPTNFVPCTRENTKIQDSIRFTSGGGSVNITYFHKDGKKCVVEDEYGEFGVKLSDYEIDLNNTEE